MRDRTGITQMGTVRQRLNSNSASIEVRYVYTTEWIAFSLCPQHPMYEMELSDVLIWFLLVQCYCKLRK